MAEAKAIAILSNEAVMLFGAYFYSTRAMFHNKKQFKKCKECLQLEGIYREHVTIVIVVENKYSNRI